MFYGIEINFVTRKIIYFFLYICTRHYQRFILYLVTMKNTPCNHCGKMEACEPCKAFALTPIPVQRPICESPFRVIMARDEDCYCGDDVPRCHFCKLQRERLNERD